MNLLIKNIGQLVTVASNGKPFKAGKEMRELNVIENAAVLIENGIIQRIATTNELSAAPDIDVLDASNRVALPGFVDSHTHTVFAGSRENEFVMRAEGKSVRGDCQCRRRNSCHNECYSRCNKKRAPPVRRTPSE